MSRSLYVCVVLAGIAALSCSSRGWAQESSSRAESPAQFDTRLAVVEVLGQGDSSRQRGSALGRAVPQASNTPIGTGVKADVTARAHVGDKPNLIPQLRAPGLAKPLAAQPLSDPVQVARASQTSEDDGQAIPANRETRTDLRRLLAAPRLRVETEGPREIEVGQETKYRLHVTNEGDPIENVVLDVAFSDNLRITKANVQPEMMESIYRFPLKDLGKGETQILTLLLLTERSGPIELATRISLSSKTAWTLNADQSIVKMEVEGSRQVSVGGELTQRVKVTNTGRSEIKGVSIEVYLPDHLRLTADQSSIIEVGLVEPGETRAFAFRTVGLQDGEEDLVYQLMVGEELVADQAVAIRATSEEFSVAITGPATSKALEPATYGIELSNLSERDAQRLAVQLLLPKGLQVLALDREATFDANKNLLIWQIDEVAANERIVLRLKTVTNETGVQTLRVQANTAEKVLASEELTVRVGNSNRRTSLDR